MPDTPAMSDPVEWRRREARYHADVLPPQHGPDAHIPDARRLLGLEGRK